jgi:CarboxypepD_reg-like domain
MYQVTKNFYQAKNSLFTICFLLITIIARGQSKFVIKGKVTDTSNAPLAKASVFCQNTTFGTVTDNEGNFALELPAGGYDMVVSYTGYDKEVVRINKESVTPAGLIIKLAKQDKSLQEVAVVGSTEVADGLKKYGSFFYEQFIGTTPNAANCTLKNPQALKFYFSKKKNRLKVLTREDLQIENKALGYNIRYQLDSFTYEYNTNIATYSGNPLYEEMNGTEQEKLVWKQNREKAYSGSRIHFMRSWYNKTLQPEGFVIEYVAGEGQNFTTQPIENTYDTTMYQKLDSTDNIEIFYSGKLRVKYNGEMPEPSFVKQFKLPPQIRVQLTVLDINEGFIIERNGYFYEQADVTNTGYWSWEKVADAVPYNYQL